MFSGPFVEVPLSSISEIVPSRCNLSFLIFLYSLRDVLREVSTLSSMQASSLPPSFLHTCSLSISSLGCKALRIVMSFLVFWSICSSFALYKNGPEYLTRRQPRFLSLWWDFFYIVWFRVVPRSPEILFSHFPFISHCLMVSTLNIPKHL